MGKLRHLPKSGTVEPAREALARLAEGHDVVGFEARVICADGSVRWLEWNTGTMPARGVVYTVGRDTTERRRAEPELRRRPSGAARRRSGAAAGCVDGCTTAIAFAARGV